jgi:GTPase-activating protein BEM2
LGASVDAVANSTVRRTEIIEVLLNWLQNGGAQDILNDGSLFQAVQSFIKSTADYDTPERTASTNDESGEENTKLQKRLKAFTTMFRSQTFRPTDRSVGVIDVVFNMSENGVSKVTPPNLDSVDAEDLVNKIDAMALVAMRNISEEVELIFLVLYFLLIEI